jgi:sarcosine oxidase delta subunit
MMETPGPVCLHCAGLDDLEFLAAGDALRTRRAKAKSAKSAVVVRFSRSRGSYERQGLLVEPRALADVERDLEAQRRE